jgi:hypothetical protein
MSKPQRTNLSERARDALLMARVRLTPLIEEFTQRAACRTDPNNGAFYREWLEERQAEERAFRSLWE